MLFVNNIILLFKVNKLLNYYKVVGIGVFFYIDLIIFIQDKLILVRVYMVFMFDENKKVSYVFLYYDRIGIIELINVVFGDIE